MSSDLGNRPASSAVSALVAPAVHPGFNRALDDLVALARQGHRPSSEFFNPPTPWLIQQMRIFQDLPPDEQERVLADAQQTTEAAQAANAEGKAAARAWSDIAIRLDNGGVSFFSQLGVARRPDLTQYFIDGFTRNRDSIAFSEENQALFAEVLPYITQKMTEHFAAGDTIVQSDQQLGDVPGRSFHARQLLFGTHYMQLPYMWRQLTFDMPQSQWTAPPDILEVSVPNWLEDLGLPEELKARVKQAGITQLVFKAPTKGLSLHLGFDYMGEHKMGPLSIAMSKVKSAHGLAVQAALSVARVRQVGGTTRNVAMVTLGPSLHGKSTLTIMIELGNSELSRQLGLTSVPEEGVYPMNDDIILLQQLPHPISTTRNGKAIQISHSIDGTENSLYAVPSGLTREDDPITYDVVRGTPGEPNAQETLENVLTDPHSGVPNYLQNPVRNMRMVLSRSRLLARKGVAHLLGAITNGRATETVSVPMEDMDVVFWQGVMRLNTIVPPLIRVTQEQYIRALMYGEAVQTGAAAGAIGRPYVEYFSDPFIIGLEDENANLMYDILQALERGGLPQEHYLFNTGGVGAESNQEASGDRYRKIPRELTLMLQEALLRDALRFEHDPILGVDVAVAVQDAQGADLVDLSQKWLPRNIYGEAEYAVRVRELKRRRYYSDHAEDKAGILRYTKVNDALYDLDDIPAPGNERELAWLLSFYWQVDQACHTLEELISHLAEGRRPSAAVLKAIQLKYEAGLAEGLQLPEEAATLLGRLGITAKP